MLLLQTIKREAPDGGLWDTKTPHTCVCGKHFITGKPIISLIQPPKLSVFNMYLQVTGFNLVTIPIKPVSSSWHLAMARQLGYRFYTMCMY